MDVYTLKDILQDTGYDMALQNPLTLEGRMRTIILAVLAAAVLGGLLWCFLGLKLIRVWSAFFGLAAGTGIGFAASAAFGMDVKMSMIIGAVLGILLAILGAVFYHVGVFLVAWITGAAFGMYILQPQDWITLLSCAAAGLVIALLTLRFAELIIIILTGIHGAVGAGTAISMLLPWKGKLIRLAICAVLAVLGIVVQFLMESGRQKKRNLEKARKIQEESSVVNDIEKARAIIDELDDMSPGEKTGAVSKRKIRRKK